MGVVCILFFEAPCRSAPQKSGLLAPVQSAPQKFVILLVYFPSCFSQETAKWPLRSSSQAATCCY